MALYPEAPDDRRFSAGDLASIATSIFLGAGMNETDAGIVAASLVAADRRGVHSHGLLRTEDYVKKLSDEGVDPTARPNVLSRKGGAIRIDGANAMGQVAGEFAMRAAIDAARETGVAFAAVGASNHCGALDYYTLMAADAGMIGIAGTNALPTMAPWGDIEKIVGLNPISVAMPAAGRPPVAIDIALGQTAHGQIRVYAQKGAPLPEGWALEAEGKATTDAQAALDRLIQPIGAFKGIGLGMMVGLLSTLLSDAGYGVESGNMADGAYAGKDGQFYMAIDIAAFTPLADFETRLSGIVETFEGSAVAPGAEAVYAPGSLENAIAADYDERGVRLAAETVAGMQRAARRVGVDDTLLR